MRRQPKAQTLAPLAGNRGFESTSLQRRVSNELFRPWASVEQGRDSRSALFHLFEGFGIEPVVR